MCLLGSGPRKREHNVSCFFMKRYVSLVCNEFVTPDYTVLYLVSKLAQAGPHQNARQNLRHGQVI